MKFEDSKFFQAYRRERFYKLHGRHDIHLRNEGELREAGKSCKNCSYRKKLRFHSICSLKNKIIFLFNICSYHKS